MITYKLNIGDRLKNDTRDLTITNRKIEEKIYVKKNGEQYSKNEIYYQFVCNKCGYDSGEYYANGVLHREYWILQGNLINRKDNCPCCNRCPQITVSNINSIVSNKEKEWMIPYFQGGYDEAKMYTPFSRQKKFFICPHCNKIKDKKIGIDVLSLKGYLPCTCGNGLSYPNKYGFELFNNQLKEQIHTFIREYTPEWAKPYRYDFYFEKDNKKYICEFDGGLGHGKNLYKNSNLTIEDTIENDKKKDKLAEDKDIQLIRIDTSISDSDYISSKILESELKNIFDFSNVDFKSCDKFACGNLIKSVCLDYENRTMNYSDLREKYGLSVSTIRKYIKHGKNIGWCKRKYIKQGKPSKKIKMFFDEDNYEIFRSANELEKISYKRFGIQLYKDCIRAVCKGKNKTYKGYRFEYVMDEEVVV